MLVPLSHDRKDVVMRTRRPEASALSILILLSCGTSSSTPDCTTDSECPLHLECLAGRCVEASAADAATPGTGALDAGAGTDASSGADAGTGEADATLEPDSGSPPDAALVALPRPEVEIHLLDGGGLTVGTNGAKRAFRAVWEDAYGISIADADAGAQQLRSRVSRMVGAGVKGLFVAVSSRDVDFLMSEDPALAGDPELGHFHQPGKYADRGYWITRGWNFLETYLSEARAAGLEVYFWYSPLIRKAAASSTAAEQGCLMPLADAGGVTTTSEQIDLACQGGCAPGGMCDLQIQFIKYLAKRYRPDGIHLEEPFFHGMTAPLTPAQAAAMNAFGEKLRQALSEIDPALVVHANVSTTFSAAKNPYGGLDIEAWQAAGWIDAFAPQLYWMDPATFGSALKAWRAKTPHASVFGGIEVHRGNTTDAGYVNPAFIEEVGLAENGSLGMERVAGSAIWPFSGAKGVKDFDDVESLLQAQRPAELFGSLGPADNPPTWIAGPGTRKALLFDGVNDYVAFPSAYAFDEYGSFTFAARVRLSTTPARSARPYYETLVTRGTESIGKGYVWIFRRGTDKRLYFRMADGTKYDQVASAETAVLEDGAWHHLAVTQDRGTRKVRFYLDGAPWGEATFATRSLAVVGGDVRLGNYPTTVPSEQYPFWGAMTDVRWYRRPLAPEQIALLAKGP